LADALLSPKVVHHRGQILANQVDTEEGPTMEEVIEGDTAKGLHKATLHNPDTIRDRQHQGKEHRECQ